MKKDEYRRWFSDQLLRQNRLLIGAMAAMIGLGSDCDTYRSNAFCDRPARRFFFQSMACVVFHGNLHSGADAVFHLPAFVETIG